MSNKRQKAWSGQVSAQNSPSPPSVEAGKDDVTTSKEISDTVEKRRMQNRLAQRNHRKKVRDHISALEARVIESMLQSSIGSSVSTPPPSTIPQFSSLSPLGSPSDVHTRHRGSEPFFDFQAEFPEGLDQTYPVPSTAQSPARSIPPNEYPTPPQSGYDGYSTPGPGCASVCSMCASCAEGVASVSAHVVEEPFYHPQIDPPPQMNAINLATPFQDAQTFTPGIDSGASPRDFFLIDSRLPPSSRPIPVTPPFSNSVENLSAQQYHPRELYNPSQQQPGWVPGMISNSRVITMPVAPSSSYHQHPSQQQNPNDPYVLHQSISSQTGPGPYLGPRPAIVSPNGQPQQSYVLVPISDLYPAPHALSPGLAAGHQQDSMYPFPRYHY